MLNFNILCLVEFEKINKNFEAKLESVKRSILYDLNKKINELKTMMKAANKPEIDEILQQREILPPLPMTTLEDFQQFEEQLNESQDISAALVRIIIFVSIRQFLRFILFLKPILQ